MRNLYPHFSIGLGASGPEGLSDIIDLLSSGPTSVNAAVFVVLHRPSDKTSELASGLQTKSRIPIEVGEEGMVALPGTCYIGEPARILSFGTDGRMTLLDGSNHRYRDRTVDTLFSSLASVFGHRAIGIVLFGALGDGSQGRGTYTPPAALLWCSTL